MLRAVIFDFDGLILDTESPEYVSWCEVYESHGHSLPLEKWCLTVGAGRGHGFDPYGHLEELLGTTADRESIRQRRRARNAELLLGQPVLEGVMDRIEEAGALGLSLGIASSSDRTWVRDHLERLGLNAKFEAIACAGDGVPAKPDPAVYRQALERLGASPEQSVAVEDSPNGVAAARAAGIYCIAVPNPITALLDFSAADSVVGSLAEVSLAGLSMLFA